MFKNLLEPIKLGGKISLSNRVWMAPLTRCRAVDNHNPNALMVEYYAQRASAGLIICEATAVMENQSAFWTEPGIYSKAQVAGWKAVTDAVHKKGGKIFLQIWHGGRACHPLMNNGAIPVAPSAIAITNNEIRTPTGKAPYVMPRALETSEIKGIVEGFRLGAQNAKDAGFDGVEVHGANGYLIDAFLRDSANQRKDIYGGTVENRARFLFEVLDAVKSVFSPECIGLRLSPLNSYNSMIDSDPVKTFTWVAEKLNSYQLGYLHIMRSDFMGLQKADIMQPIRDAYKGILVGNMGYTAEEANIAISEKKLDAVAFGVPFISNPDLPERFASGAALNAPDQSTFYTQGKEGYTDYPFLKK
ncbi:MAG: alkene reductase [Proteobacteria bacterium]|nr:alkene reductase [Pseudomonadota bacterium]